MTKDKQAPPTRHIPRRTCLGCREVKAKRELIRIVCLPTGEVDVDPTGKKSGRGAYLCARRSCWEDALSAGRLEYALRARLRPEHREKLVNYAQGFDNINGH